MKLLRRSRPHTHVFLYPKLVRPSAPQPGPSPRQDVEASTSRVAVRDGCFTLAKHKPFGFTRAPRSGAHALGGGGCVPWRVRPIRQLCSSKCRFCGRKMRVSGACHRPIGAHRTPSRHSARLFGRAGWRRPFEITIDAQPRGPHPRILPSLSLPESIGRGCPVLNWSSQSQLNRRSPLSRCKEHLAPCHRARQTEATISVVGRIAGGNLRPSCTDCCAPHGRAGPPTARQQERSTPSSLSLLTYSPMISPVLRWPKLCGLGGRRCCGEPPVRGSGWR